MRFRRHPDEPVLELRHTRVLFFFFGPFYLLWLHLWLDGLIIGAIVWLSVHGVLVLTRSAMGAAGGLDVQRLLAAFDAVRAGAAAGVPAESAMQELMRMLIPIYAAGFALLAWMSALTPLLPRYLRWRLARAGWRQLQP